MSTITTSVPTLSPGLTTLEAPSPRTPALHELTLAALADLEGRAYWIDSRSAASTHAWLEASIDQLDRLRIARAFTAYQHHSLVHVAADRATEGDLLIVPWLEALYADDDVPEPQARSLLDDVLATIDSLAEEGCAVLVTADREPIGERADHTIVASETDLGIAYEGDDFETMVYRGPGFWQTTIPYWADLLGRVDPEEPITAMASIPMQRVLG